MKKNNIIFIGLILFAGLFRLIPHSWNFTPLLAACIFSGYKIKPIGLAMFLPLITIFLGDIFIGFYDGMVWVYTAYIVTIAIAIFTSKSNSKQSKIGNIVFGSLSFFLISNLGVWMSGLIYPQNFEGLVACFVAAIPFYKNTIIGTVLYSGVFWGIADILEKQESTKVSVTKS